MDYAYCKVSLSFIDEKHTYHCKKWLKPQRSGNRIDHYERYQLSRTPLSKMVMSIGCSINPKKGTMKHNILGSGTADLMPVWDHFYIQGIGKTVLRMRMGDSRISIQVE